MKKRKSAFVEGPIQPSFIAESISKHQSKTGIGGHEIFLGQVRQDDIEGKQVSAIEYTAYQDLADEKIHEIREKAFELYDLNCLHIYHSLGRIQTGEICFFVFSSSPHRKDCREATAFLVDEIKKEVPIFGKEIFEDESHQWKVNKN